MTPINLSNPTTNFMEKAREDYLRERAFFDGNGATLPRWDDTRTNAGQIGSLFGFVQQTGNQNLIEFFKIVDKLPVTERREEWDIRQHVYRQVLVLSPKLGEMTWGEFKRLNGFSERWKLRGTVRSRLRFKLKLK